MKPIMNIVEWVLVWCIVSCIVVPYITHLLKMGYVDGLCGAEVGNVYYDIVYGASHHHSVEMAASLAVVFFIAASFPLVAYALCIWAFQIAILIYQSIKRGYHPTAG